MNNEEFQIQIGASIDLSRPQRALEEFVRKSSRITKAINLDDGSRQFDKLTKYVNQTGQSFVQLTRYIEDADGYLAVARNEIVSVSTNFDKLNQTINATTKHTEIFKTETGALKTVINDVNAQGEKIRTTITEMDDGYGKLVKSTEVYNVTLGETISKHTDMIENHTKEIESLRKLGEAQSETSKYTKQSVTDTGALKTEIVEVNAKGEKLVTTILKMTDSMGNLTTSTSKVNETLGITISKHTELTEDLVAQAEAQRQLNLALVETSNTTEKLVKEDGTLVTIVTSINAEGERLRTTITEQNNGMGRVVKTTEVYNETLQQQVSLHKESINDQVAYQEQLKKEAEALKKDEEAKKRNAKATQQNADANRTLGQTFTDVVKKVSKFYLASLPIRTFQKAITETITTVKEFDSAVTELAKVSTLSGNSMDEYTRKLGELGETVARTRTEMVESATEFKKAGFSEEDSAALAQLSALYQNTADEELSASEATSVLVSQMKAFNYTAEDAIHITDAINKVSQDFAVSSADIGKGLTQAGASLQTYGNSFDQTIGLLTAGTEIFQGKSQQVK